jgi:hypothetical protein
MLGDGVDFQTFQFRARPYSLDHPVRRYRNRKHGISKDWGLLGNRRVLGLIEERLQLEAQISAVLGLLGSFWFLEQLTKSNSSLTASCFHV